VTNCEYVNNLDKCVGAKVANMHGVCKSLLHMPYAHVEFAGGDAFRCISLSDGTKDYPGSTFCLQTGTAWDILRQVHVDDVLKHESKRFMDAQEKLNARVCQAHATHTEVEGLAMPKPITHEMVAQNQESRNKLMNPLLEAQHIEQHSETDIVTRLHQFWVITVLRKSEGTYLIVHGAHPDQNAAERQARAVIDTELVNEADVISARSWFAVMDFDTADLACTTYVNDDAMNSTMRNAHWKQEMAKAMTEKAKLDGVDLPTADRPGFVMNPEFSATVSSDA